MSANNVKYVKLNGRNVSHEILNSEDVKRYLAEVAVEIKDRFDSLNGNSDDSHIVVWDDRKKRSAVDVYVDRTEKVVKGHLLEKAVEQV